MVTLPIMVIGKVISLLPRDVVVNLRLALLVLMTSIAQMRILLQAVGMNLVVTGKF